MLTNNVNSSSSLSLQLQSIYCTILPNNFVILLQQQQQRHQIPIYKTNIVVVVVEISYLRAYIYINDDDNLFLDRETQIFVDFWIHTSNFWPFNRYNKEKWIKILALITTIEKKTRKFEKIAQLYDIYKYSKRKNRTFY